MELWSKAARLYHKLATEHGSIICVELVCRHKRCEISAVMGHDAIVLGSH